MGVMTDVFRKVHSMRRFVQGMQKYQYSSCFLKLRSNYE